MEEKHTASRYDHGDSRHLKGLDGERQAEAHLAAQGMQPLARRFRAEDGEIDLILLDGETLVFAEVKNRPQGRRGDGLLAVTPTKQQRMLHAAAAWLAQHPEENRSVRFDVVELTADGLLHVRDAFRET